jgi:UDP:flavonoid glycosyltransferase YjiC (YdhE family)
MRILFTSIAKTGHLTPLLPYARALARHGHEVRVAAAEGLTEAIEAAGLTPAPFGGIDDEELARIIASDPEPDRMTGFMTREVFVGAFPRTALPKLRETVRDWRPDLIVRSAGEYAAAIAADEAGIPHVRVSVSNGHTFRDAIAPFDALRAEQGLAPDGGASLRNAPAFSAFPASLEEPGGDGGARPQIRVRLPRETASPGAPRPDWLPEGDAPFVYMTFGTVLGASDRARATFRAALDAVADQPVRVLLTTGPAMDVDALGQVPGNVRLEPWAPQDLVLPHAAALICHGGSGTVIGGLAAGVPMVVTPVGADQPENARRIEAVGAGIAVADRDPASIRAALERALTDPAMRAGAGRLAAEIAATPDVDAAVTMMTGFARAA